MDETATKALATMKAATIDRTLITVIHNKRVKDIGGGFIDLHENQRY